MQFLTSALTVLAAAAGLTSVSAAPAGVTETVAYDPTYSASLSTSQIACSDGSNGLLTKGYSTLGALPKFPYVGASFTVEGYNSANCGKCYKIYYSGTGISIYVLAVDHAASGFVLNEAAMNALTNNQAEHLGRISASYAEADSSLCGF